jgi:hypothetical protein
MNAFTKILSVVILLCSFTATGQKIYNIAAMETQSTLPGYAQGSILPLKQKIFITDTLFYGDGMRYKYTITKKVDSSYFKITDGIKEFTVHIGNNIYPNKYLKKLKSTGYISIEGENTITSYYY